MSKFGFPGFAHGIINFPTKQLLHAFLCNKISILNIFLFSFRLHKFLIKGKCNFPMTRLLVYWSASVRHFHSMLLSEHLFIAWERCRRRLILYQMIIILLLRLTRVILGKPKQSKKTVAVGAEGRGGGTGLREFGAEDERGARRGGREDWYGKLVADRRTVVCEGSSGAAARAERLWFSVFNSRLTTRYGGTHLLSVAGLLSGNMSLWPIETSLNCSLFFRYNFFEKCGYNS